MRWAERNADVESALASARGHGGRGNVRVECPFCVSSKTLRADASLSVNLTTGLYYCHRCATGGKLAGEQYIDLSNPDDPRCQQLSAEEAEARLRAATPPDGFMPLWCPPYSDALCTEDARAYAAKRNLTPELQHALQLGCVLDGYYGGRIVIPFTEGEVREWWGWVARDYTGRAEKKYLYPRGMPRAEHLFNGEILDVETDEPAIIVEGALDAAAYWPDAVPTLGKPANLHLQRFRNAARPVAFLLDGDAWEEAMAYAANLRFEGKRAGYVRLPPRTDPDEVDRAWAREECVRCLDSPL